LQHEPNKTANSRSTQCPANDGFGEFYELQDRILDIDKRLTELGIAEQESTSRFRELRRTRIREIDVEMKTRHDAELEMLKEQHKAELVIARQEFESFKRKHDEDMQKMHEQRYEMVEQRKLVTEDMRRIREEWRHDFA